MARYAFLPARGGSKRIPRKNIRDFAGKPMIQWPIEALLSSNMFDEIFVSSDDHQILELAEKLGAKPVERSVDLSGDFVGILEVVKEFIFGDYWKFDEQDLLLCTFPTSVFLSEQHIVKAIGSVEAEGQRVVSLKRFPHPLERAIVGDKESYSMKNPRNAQVRTQDLRPHFYDAAYIYAAMISGWVGISSILGDPFKPLFIKDYDSIDIDNPEDLEHAEKIFRSL